MLLKPAAGILDHLYGSGINTGLQAAAAAAATPLPAGSIVEAMVEELDMYPSLAELAGFADAVPATGAQGTSWVPLLLSGSGGGDGGGDNNNNNNNNNNNKNKNNNNNNNNARSIFTPKDAVYNQCVRAACRQARKRPLCGCRRTSLCARRVNNAKKPYTACVCFCRE